MPLLAIVRALSNWAIDAKAQQDPQIPWFLTLVTLFRDFQSKEEGDPKSPLLMSLGGEETMLRILEKLKFNKPKLDISYFFFEFNSSLERY